MRMRFDLLSNAIGDQEVVDAPACVVLARVEAVTPPAPELEKLRRSVKPASKAVNSRSSSRSAFAR